MPNIKSLLELGQQGHNDLKTQNSPQVIASVITARLAGLQHLNMTLQGGNLLAGTWIGTSEGLLTMGSWVSVQRL